MSENFAYFTIISALFRTGPVNGFSFHCWLRLDPLVESNQNAYTKELYRRQLYSFYTASGNGFEAFITAKGVLIVAVANKKEFLAVPLDDFPLRDEKWHSLQIVHSTAKRPFGSSYLQSVVPNPYVVGPSRIF